MSTKPVHYELAAQLRSDIGEGASRRLRQAGSVPGIVYGNAQAPLTVSLSHKDMVKALENEGIYSHILTLNVDGKKEAVILKALQRHPFKPRLLHIDFQRVNANAAITMHVPLHFLNEESCPGIKAGGILSKNLIEVELKCLPKDLPEFLNVDLSTLELDHAIHISQLSIPKNVELLALKHGDDMTVVSIHKPRIEEEAAPVEAEASAEGSDAAPAADAPAE